MKRYTTALVVDKRSRQSERFTSVSPACSPVQFFPIFLLALALLVFLHHGAVARTLVLLDTSDAIVGGRPRSRDTRCGLVLGVFVLVQSEVVVLNVK